MRHLEPIIARPSAAPLSEVLNASWFVAPADEPRSGIMQADGRVGVMVSTEGFGSAAGVGSLKPDSDDFDAVHLGLAPQVSLIGLRFEPGAFHSLFGLSFRAFVRGERTRRLTDLEGVLQGALRELSREACGFGQVEDVVATALLRGARGPDPRWLKLRSILDEMCATDERVDSERWARRFGCGRRQFERLFVEYVGLTPKVFFRLERVNRARAQLKAGADLASTAQACGFADQAHLTREFRRVLGVTPLAYRGRVVRANDGG